MNLYTTSTYEITRNEAGESTSITWTFKDYSDFTTETQSKVIDADGNTSDFEVQVVNEDDLVETRTATYEIPEADRTTLSHGESHPHNHENELAFQEKYAKWWNDWQASL